MAMAASVHVASLSFCRLECDHSELFQPEYKRSNRTKGLKILRCFPHCCPNHIERSYCGSSLHVIVQTEGDAAEGGAPLSRARLADSVFLFARFECSAEPGLQLGDLVASADMVRETQSEDNPEGRWIPGVKERASTLSSAMKSVAQAVGDHTLVYQLNGKVYSRWYYDWESGANKAQRLMRHVLKAYVFERCGPADAAGEPREKQPSMLRVIGIVSSPEFTVISYRRAPMEAGQPMMPAPASASGGLPAGPAPAIYRDSPSVRDQEELLRRQAYGDYLHRGGMDGIKRPLPGDARWPPGARGLPHDVDAKRRRHASPGPPDGGALPRRRYAPAPTLRNASPAELFENRVLWEHANAHMVTVSKNLALVFWFIQWTPLDYYALFVDELIHLINHQLLEPLVSSSGGHVEKHNCFSRVLLVAAQFARPLRAPLSAELESLVRVMAHTALWFFSSDMRWRMHAFLHRCNIASGAGSLITDKARLRAAFLELVQDLEEQLNRHVFAATPFGSLANVAEEIIAAVYTHELYHPKRATVRQILGEHGFVGWRPFVAQMRDSFIALSTLKHRQPSPSPSLAFPRANPFERLWNGEWILDLEETAWKQVEPPATPPPSAMDSFSLFSVLDIVTQMTSIRLGLHMDERRLRIESHAPFFFVPAGMTPPTAAAAGSGAASAATHQAGATPRQYGGSGMSLVLDGKSRVFRCFPNGWSTAMSDGALGDYAGSLRLETPERLVLYVETFRWSRTAANRSYHLRLRAECWSHQRMFINGEILETNLATTFSDDELHYMSELKINAKLKAVNKMHVRQHPPQRPPNAGHHIAWRRLGSFRMVYKRK
ncbi:hypothetical protein P43SY_002456 [Pythium insidiosum]|uniref:Uncharacterized protein n=1 Tax=Pythium insidiosum TaxID=114742 RepID=A0AAD5Q873_PYTIN|nr:hypothetical protein P43SY_002456 [Pythium insidiosum]